MRLIALKALPNRPIGTAFTVPDDQARILIMTKSAKPAPKRGRPKVDLPDPVLPCDSSV